jgi:hypothetical protein
VAKSGINYLFPPEEILNLPTWRFVLHFMVTPDYHHSLLRQAIANLKTAQWKIIMFPFSLDTLALDESGEAVSVPIEVPDERRRRPNSLADYESDVWKLMGNMMNDGFGDMYYEAVDWQK